MNCILDIESIRGHWLYHFVLILSSVFVFRNLKYRQENANLTLFYFNLVTKKYVLTFT